jgi:hypothetical protein
MGISENALQLYTSGYTIEGMSASTVGASVFPRSANQFPISTLFEYIFVGFYCVFNSRESRGDPLRTT